MIEPWREQAACRGYPVEWWFPSGVEGVDHRRRREITAMGVRICETCPVRRECLEHAVSQGPALLGTWGGFTESQRRRMKGAIR